MHVPFTVAVMFRALIILLFMGVSACAQKHVPIPVKLVEADGKWSLIRGGKPYAIQGAGGNGSLALLAKLGGNSTRTWGADQLEKGLLDEAHAQGLTVSVGLWLRHDLDYTDEKQVAEQTRLAMEAVRRCKDHPAVLLWGIGNEMEGDGENLAVWKHIEQLAKQIKAEDPTHPTMTVLAEIGGNKIKHLNHYCPSIDIVGINAYGGAPSVPKRYREVGGTKPYMLAEFGPRGPWDLDRNEIGSYDEELGKAKAAVYTETFEAIKQDTQLCLGGYAFKWGYKQEATPTWFGMFLADGRKTPSVDAMSTAWTNQPPADHSPEIDSLTLGKTEGIKVKSKLTATLKATDPEGQPLKVKWVLMEDAEKHLTAGYYQESPPVFKDHLEKTSNTEATFRVPDEPGLYRIFAYVGDKHGGADVANVVFRAEK